MDGKKKNTEGKKLNVNDKLTWEAPKLFCLDKGKTEGGNNTSFLEATNYGTIS